MDFAAIIDGVESFAAYVGELASVIGHVGRVAPLHDYCAGLLASEGRRSVEPMAALTAPAEVSVQHSTKSLRDSPLRGGLTGARGNQRRDRR